MVSWSSPPSSSKPSKIAQNFDEPLRNQLAVTLSAMNISRVCFDAVCLAAESGGSLHDLRASLQVTFDEFERELRALPRATAKEAVDTLGQMVSIALASPGRRGPGQLTGRTEALSWADILLTGIRRDWGDLEPSPL
jgi:hypothetical protein